METLRVLFSQFSPLVRSPPPPFQTHKKNDNNKTQSGASIDFDKETGNIIVIGNETAVTTCVELINNFKANSFKVVLKFDRKVGMYHHTPPAPTPFTSTTTTTTHHHSPQTPSSAPT